MIRRALRRVWSGTIRVAGLPFGKDLGGDDGLRRRVDRLEDELAMLRLELEDARRRADQAMQRAETAVATAEVAADKSG